MPHGRWCNSRTYPTRCQYCGKQVFFFMCDCGSRVVFDALGQPWPIHHCEEWLEIDNGPRIISLEKFYGKPVKSQLPEYNRKLRMQRNQTNISASASSAQSTLPQRESSPSLQECVHDIHEYVEQEYTERIQAASCQIKSNDFTLLQPILRMDPYNGVITSENGIVREIILAINMSKRLAIPSEGHLGSAALGPFGRTKYVQITIHTEALGENNYDSFTFLLEASTFNKLSLKHGDFVSVALQGIQILDREPFWVCTHIKRAFD